MTTRKGGELGFSILELLIAVAIATVITGAVFAMLDPAHGAFRVQPESADVAQRLRAAADAVLRDVSAAGSQPVFAPGEPLPPVSVAAVFPYRIGRRNADPPGTFDTTRISVWSVSPSAPQALLAAPLPSGSAVATIAPGGGCPPADPTCGFMAGTTVVVMSHSGARDLFTVTAVDGSLLSLDHNLADSAFVHAASATTLAEVIAQTYFLRTDPALGYAQLRRYDTGAGADVPVVDHVVGLVFEYWGEADPPRMIDGAAPARTTYGPLPPPTGVQWTAYPPGENCVFTRSPLGNVVPRLAQWSAQPELVPLSAASLTDGPWCPDDASPNRYDADLLRVRQVVMTVRVEAAADSVRGPAGRLFTRAGTARDGRWVPDRQLRLVVVPRALSRGR